MKALPKRKGNAESHPRPDHSHGLNESPSEKEGKCGIAFIRVQRLDGLNESPSEKEGKSVVPYFAHR